MRKLYLSAVPMHGNKRSIYLKLGRVVEHDNFWCCVVLHPDFCMLIYFCSHIIIRDNQSVTGSGH